MAGNGKRADYEAMGDAIARSLAPHFVELRSEISALRSDVRAELQDMRGELHEQRMLLQQHGVRLDRIVENTGSHYRTLEARVSRIESKLNRDDTTS